MWSGNYSKAQYVITWQYLVLIYFNLFFESDYKGWTALHHAAFGGYTRTMQIILNTNVKCTDKVDEEGVSLTQSLAIYNKSIME